MDKNYLVYWIKLPEHGDPYSEGYVGITHTSLAERFRGHKKNKRKTTLTSAAKKYGWDTFEKLILHDHLSQDDALALEKRYRPSQRIGWNQQAGGELGVEPEWYDDPENAKRHAQATSERTKQGIAEKDSTEERSYRAKGVWEREGYRDSRKGLFAKENNPQFGKFGADHPAYGHRHTDDAKQRIGAAHRGRTVSDETKQKLSTTRTVKFAIKRQKELAKLDADPKAYLSQIFEFVDGVLLNKVDRNSHAKKGAVVPVSTSVLGKPIKASYIIELLTDGEIKASLPNFQGEQSKASKVSDSDRHTICQRRAAGESYSKISKDYPLVLTAVRAICKDWGPRNGYRFQKLQATQNLRGKYSDEVRHSVCNRVAKGESYIEVARDIGMGETTAYEIVRTWGPANGHPLKKAK